MMLVVRQAAPYVKLTIPKTSLEGTLGFFFKLPRRIQQRVVRKQFPRRVHPFAADSSFFIHQEIGPLSHRPLRLANMLLYPVLLNHPLVRLIAQ